MIEFDELFERFSALQPDTSEAGDIKPPGLSVKAKSIEALIKTAKLRVVLEGLLLDMHDFVKAGELTKEEGFYLDGLIDDKTKECR